MKYKVKVTITAQCSYEVEVDERSESMAVDAACAMWRDQLPNDFQVEKGYITDWEDETEQLTFKCEECAVEIFKGQPGFEDEMCPKCSSDFAADDLAFFAVSDAADKAVSR